MRINQQVVRVNEDGESPVLNPVRSTKVALQAEKGGWVSLEMRKVVADWFRFPEDNRGLVVHAVLNNDDPSAAAAHMQHKTTQQLVVIDSQSDPSLVRLIHSHFFVQIITSCRVKCRCRSLRWWRQTVANTGQSERSVSTATRLQSRRAAVATRSQLTLSNSAGTGSSHRKSTKPITVRASARTCFSRNTLTRTSCSRRIPPVLRALVAHHAKCPPSRCSTLTTSLTSFTAICPEWSSIDAVAHRRAAAAAAGWLIDAIEVLFFNFFQFFSSFSCVIICFKNCFRLSHF